MQNKAYSLLVALGLFSCGSDGGGDTSSTTGNAFTPSYVDIDGDGRFDGVTVDVNGDGIADGVDVDNDGVPDAALPPGFNGSGAPPGGGSTGGASGGTQGGGTSSGQPVDLFGDDAGGGTQGRDASVVDIEPAVVQCASSACTIENNFSCCEQPSDSGWSGMCIGSAACNAGGGGPPRNATSECDSRDDCGGLVDQYCCFIQQGPPESVFQAGTPYGRECRTLSACNDAMAFPPGSGRFSCQQDSDCPNNLKCMPEGSGASVGGGGRTGRPWVKVCG